MNLIITTNPVIFIDNILLHIFLNYYYYNIKVLIFVKIVK